MQEVKLISYKQNPSAEAVEVLLVQFVWRQEQAIQ